MAQQLGHGSITSGVLFQKPIAARSGMMERHGLFVQTLAVMLRSFMRLNIKIAFRVLALFALALSALGFRLRKPPQFMEQGPVPRTAARRDRRREQQLSRRQLSGYFFSS